MKVSFPFMESPVVYYKILDMLNHDVVKPPRPTQKTFNLGVKYAPEFACFPLKVTLGNIIELHEMGVDTILTSGGYGPCRAGYYGEVQQKILDDLGLDIDIIIFEQVKGDWQDFINNVRILKQNTNIFNLLRSVYIGYRIAHSLDRMLKLLHKRRAHAVDKRAMSELWDEIQERYLTVESSSDVDDVEEWARNEIESQELEMPPEAKRYKVGVVGEIYVVMEGSTNNYIEEMLNEMGVEVERSHYLSEYIDSHMVPWKKKQYQHILDKGEEYFEYVIGGHAKRNVGHIIDYKQRGFDGIIHLKPFGCLPEVVSQSMLDRISEDLNIPILPMSIDEQTAKAHMKTRIEAFMDLIKQKKEERMKEEEIAS